MEQPQSPKLAFAHAGPYANEEYYEQPLFTPVGLPTTAIPIRTSLPQQNLFPQAMVPTPYTGKLRTSQSPTRAYVRPFPSYNRPSSAQPQRTGRSSRPASARVETSPGYPRLAPNVNNWHLPPEEMAAADHSNDETPAPVRLFHPVIGSSPR